MDIAEEFWYVSAFIYSRMNPFILRHFGVDKVGFFLRKIKRPRKVRVEGLFFQVEPEVSTCFGRIIGGRFNEEETHKLLRRILGSFDKIDLFVDVGANIGEFVVDMAASDKIKRVIGFEPNPYCVKSCVKSVEHNGLANVEVRQTVLKDCREEVRFDTSGDNAHLHSFLTAPPEAKVMYTSTIDDEIQESNVKAVVLMDVEGAEPLVMAGGRNFIKANLPFIIFEYNEVSRVHFSLDDVRSVLPPGYEIYRLRMGEGSLDGFLDRSLAQTYNCVAVHKDSPFYKVAQSLVR